MGCLGSAPPLRGTALIVCIWSMLACISWQQESPVPSFSVSPPSLVEFSNSTGARIPCSPNGYPLPEVKWLLADGSSMVNIEGLRETRHDGSLALSPFRAEEFRQDVHATSYKCLLTNARGAVVSNDVRVKAVVSQPYDVYVYDVFTMPGKTAVMRCHVPSFLANYVNITSWIRDSAVTISPQSNDESAKYVITPTGELYIRDIEANDASTSFQCETNNGLTGEKKRSLTSGKIFVTDPKGNVPPKIIFSKKTVNVEIGQKAFLPCEAQGNPAPSVTWSKVTTVGVSLAKTLFSNSLSISTTDTSDAGVYVCTATNEAGSVSIETQLTVRAPLDVSIEPSSKAVDAGQAISLVCKITGHPVDNISWFKNGQSLPMDGVQLNTNTTAHISSMSSALVGIYQCVAKNDRDSAFGIAVLSLGDSPPFAISGFEDKTLQPSTSVSLKCVFSGNPTPEVSWFLDGLSLSGDRRWSQAESIDDKGQIVSTLTLRQGKTEDGGFYSCKGKNLAGKIEHGARINIYGRLGARHVVKTTAVSGEVTALSCPFYGYPYRKVTWEKDDVILPTGVRQTILGDDRLSITHVHRTADSGTYSCTVVDNKGHTVRAEIQLRVLVPPKLAPFSFQDELVREGMRGRLQCVVLEGDLPITLKWLKDGQSIPSNIGVSIRELDEFSSILTIASIRPRHNGNYTCLATNPAATVTFTTRLAVNVAPKIIPFSFQESGLVEGVLARISCVVYQGDLPIDIKWLKDGRPVSSIPGIIVRSIDDYSNILTVESIRSHHTGNYSCVASNSAATVVHSSMLSVNVPPKIVPFSFQDEHLLEGMLVRVSCVVSRGDLPLTITWLKDGLPIPLDLPVAIRDFDEYSSVLSIDPVTTRYNGNYTCVVRNEAASASHTANLCIQVPPKWVVEPEDMTVKSNNDVYIHCKADGLPLPEITWLWTKDSKGRGRQPVGSNNVTMYPNGTILIKHITKDQEGNYYCTASNGVGLFLSKAFYLSVLAPPVLENKQKFVAVNKSDNLTLNCSASGDLPMTFTWMSGKSIISSKKDSRFVIKETKPNGISHMLSQLTITWLDRKDSATYKCQVENSYGMEEIEFLISVQETPDVPEINLSPLAGNRSVTITWTRPFNGNSKIVSFIVEYKKHSENWQVKRTNTSVNGDITSFTIKDLLPAMKYVFRVAARNSVGLGIFSKEIEAITEEDVPSGPPQNVDVESTDQHTLRVTWKPPHKSHWNGAILGYHIGYKIEGSSNKYTINSLEVPEDYTDDLIYQLVDLKMFSHYSVIVQAFNAKGKGPASKPVTAMTSEDVPSRPPEGIRCSALSSKSIYVLWDPPANETINGILRGYKILYKPTMEWYDSATQIRVVQTAKVTLMGLDVNTNYSIKLLAFTKVGDGAKSQPVFCKTFEDVPEAPDDMKVLPSSSDSVVVAWKSPKNSNGAITKYNVYYKSIADGQELDSAAHEISDATLMTEQVNQEPSSHTSRSDSQFLEVKGLKKNKKYAFWVTASSVIGEGPSSKIKAQTVADSVAKSASFGGVIKTPWKRDVVMPCKAVGMPSPQRKWMIGEKTFVSSGRNIVLSDGTLLINKVSSEDSGNYTCAIYNEHGKDEVKYNLLVQVPPSAPPLDVVSKGLTSIQLQWKPGPNGGDKVKGYILHYRPDSSGPWERKELRPDHHLYTLDSLACGANYQLYLEAFNSIGTGAPCDVITVSTKGSDVPNPSKEALIREGSTFATIQLDTWPSTGCHVDKFLIEYKKLQDQEWTLLGDNIQTTQKKLVIPKLAPSTWYSLRLTAVTNGGYSTVEYNFATHTPNGGTILPPEIHLEKNPDPVYVFYLDPYIFIPSVALLIVVIIAAVIVCVCVKRKNGSMGSPSDSASTLNTWSRGHHAYPPQYSTIARRADKDASPYATAQLPECFVQYPGQQFFDQADPALARAWAAGTLHRRPTNPASSAARSSLQQTNSDGALPSMQETAFVFNNPPGFTPAKGKRPNDEYDQPPVGI